jgi:hypothetical protein
MAIYEMTRDQMRVVTETSFNTAGVRERGDLQRLLREQIQIVSHDTLIISEEFGDWTDSRRRIDLLGLDKDANLVVIELKRTDDGGHMELQAVRYAAMVSQMTFDQAVEAYANYLQTEKREEDARERILEFLGWEDANDDQFAQDVRIVLVSAEFSKEITTAVMWLNEKGLDVRCVRLKPYNLDGRTLLDVQQVLPLPEANEYQIQLREKKQQERKARSQKWDEAAFMQELEKKTGPALVELAKTIHHWINPLVDKVTWGQAIGRMVPTIFENRTRYQLFVVRDNGQCGVRFVYLRKQPPFDAEPVIHELLRKMNEIPGLSFTAEDLGKKRAFPLQSLAAPGALERNSRPLFSG